MLTEPSRRTQGWFCGSFLSAPHPVSRAKPKARTEVDENSFLVGRNQVLPVIGDHGIQAISFLTPPPSPFPTPPPQLPRPWTPPPPTASPWPPLAWRSRHPISQAKIAPWISWMAPTRCGVWLRDPGFHGDLVCVCVCVVCVCFPREPLLGHY